MTINKIYPERGFLRSNKNLMKDDVLQKQDLIFEPDKRGFYFYFSNFIGKKLLRNIKSGDIIRFGDIKNNIGAIIVVRNSSTRLPSKAIKKIMGKESIIHLIERIKRCKLLNTIVLATSDKDSDDIFESIAKKENIKFFRGSLNDVALRFYEAAEKYNIDQIVRITGDDILRDEIMIDKAIKSHLVYSKDVTLTKNLPYGCNTEIFTKDVLKLILDNANCPENTGYLEWYLNNDNYFSINEVTSDYEFSKKIRLTLDYEDDLSLFRILFEKFYAKKKYNFTLKDVLKLFEEKPSLIKINEHISPKYVDSDLDCSLNIKSLISSSYDGSRETILVKNLNPQDGFIIAETACGHEGDINKLFLLIDAAAIAKASAVKFQIFIPTERSHKGHSEWLIFNNLCLSEDAWIKASKYAKSKNLYVFADVFGIKSFQIASNCNVDGYKIHSEDMLNISFIKKVAQSNKIIMLGVGGIKRIELYKLIKEIRSNNLSKNIVLIPGVQVFPTPIEAHSLKEVIDLISKYQSEYIKVGFADHIDGDLPEAISLPQKALLIGAVILEKHITLKRELKWEDYQSALGSNEFIQFVREVKQTCGLLSEVSKMNKYEIKYRKMFKKMPVCAKNLIAGTTIDEKDIIFQKNDDFTIPLSTSDLIGKKLRKNIEEGSIFRLEYLQQKVAAIIVVRNSSTRLPQKALKKIAGFSTISLLIKRIKRCSNLDCIILATSTESIDDIFEDIAQKENIKIFRGSLNNVALRFYEAAQYYGIDQIVRVTGDDLLRDEIMLDKAIESHLYKSCDVTFIRNMPFGCSSEIFSIDTLKTILETAKEPLNTEYLEYFLDNDRYFSINNVYSNYKFDNSLRLTLDYEQDFLLFREIFDYFFSIGEKEFTLQMVLDFLEKKPDLICINKNMKKKFDNLTLDISLNI